MAVCSLGNDFFDLIKLTAQNIKRAEAINRTVTPIVPREIPNTKTLTVDCLEISIPIIHDNHDRPHIYIAHNVDILLCLMKVPSISVEKVS